MEQEEKQGRTRFVLIAHAGDSGIRQSQYERLPGAGRDGTGRGGKEQRYLIPEQR